MLCLSIVSKQALCVFVCRLSSLDNFILLSFCLTSNFLPKNLQADVDNSGTIDYGEFIAAMLHVNKAEKEDYLSAAFSYFDKDGSGYITADELQKACEEFGMKDVRLEEIIQEVDQDNVCSSTGISFFQIYLVMHEW